MRKILSMIAIASAAVAASPALATGATVLKATMTGAAEIPGPGDPHGAGEATVTLKPAQGQVCFMLHVHDLPPATMAHIHAGDDGVAGPVVVALDAPASGMASGCKPVAADVIAAIAKDPAGYYVNVHTAANPKGAIRGQLKP